MKGQLSARPRLQQISGSRHARRRTAMTEPTGSRYQSGAPQEPGAWAQGLFMFAAVMMFVGGGFQAIMGLAAIFENEFYTVTPNYVLEFDVSAWGWIHLLLGLLVVLAGYGLLSGQTWARVVGII